MSNDHPLIPEQYIVTRGGAYWQHMPPGSHRTWYYAPKQVNGEMDWAATVECELSDEPIEQFLDSITDKVLFMLSAEAMMDHKMELYELIHACNEALGMPVAGHANGQSMGQHGVGFSVGGFTFDLMEDMGDGNSTWLTCYNPADINSLEPGTTVEMFDQYPGPYDGTVWRTADFKEWVRSRVFSVLATRDFMYVQPDPIKREEYSIGAASA